MSRISIRFCIHVWLECSIPTGCFYDKLCGITGAGSCTLESVDSIINWYWKKSNHGQNESAFALPQSPHFFAVANFTVIVFLSMIWRIENIKNLYRLVQFLRFAYIIMPDEFSHMYRKEKKIILILPVNVTGKSVPRRILSSVLSINHKMINFLCTGNASSRTR